jgi:hypothetical protein
MHVCLFDGAPSFTMVTMWACSHQIVPGMLASQVTRYDMIYGEISYVLATILAGEVISTQDFSLGKFHSRPRAMDHLFQAYNRWARKNLPNGLDLTTSVQNQAGFSIDDQSDSTTGIADVNRLKISVKHQYRGLHGYLQCREL